MGDDKFRLEVSLNHLTEVQKFVNLANSCKGMITLKSSVYVVDGRSLLGILSLDLSHALAVYFECEEDMKKFEQFKM